MQEEEGSNTVTLLQKTVDLSDSPHCSAASPTEGLPSPLNPSFSASTTIVKKITEDFIQNDLQEIKKIIKKAKGPRGAFVWTVVLMSFNIAGSAHVIW